MPGINDFFEYWLDSAQRSVLFWDVLRERGNDYLDHRELGKPPVLIYDSETVLDGRSLDRPVNYALLRIVPPAGLMFDPCKRPYVIIDPRAGHGPGIGGFKRESQIGIAQRARHPVYFVMFFPDPQPGQTLEDVGRAQARFLQKVAALHPDAPKPCVVGNCQAGWAVSMLAAVAPELMSLIVLNGAPLSYWAGMEGKNPMRYLGGLTGGAWLASFMSDMGGGKFDGAQLVWNFENLDPSHTLWAKPYHLYANVDSERQRFLEFERWWGGFFFFNEEEMEAIVENLFIGNKLQSANISLRGGENVDLKNIRVPIVIFASRGDDITPPQQALNWICDTYRSVDDIIANDQVIVYLLHESIGHLGIFVSGQVAQKEHAQIMATMEFFDLLPPGLYELEILEATGDEIDTQYRVRFVERTIADLRRMDDEQVDAEYFTSLAAVSEVSNQVYKTWLRPWVRLAVNHQSANLMRRLHPLRVQRYMVSNMNPFCLWWQPTAQLVRRFRAPVSPSNPYLEWERVVSRSIETSLDMCRLWRDTWARQLYKNLYGPTGLGALFPPQVSATVAEERREERINPLLERLPAQADEGGFVEGAMRMLLLLSRADGIVERQVYRLGRQVAATHPRLRGYKKADLRRIARQQYLYTRLNRSAAIAGLAVLLPTAGDRQEAAQIVNGLLWATRPPNLAERAVIEKIGSHFDVTLGRG